MSFFRIELLRDDFTPFIGLRNYATRLPADTEFLGTLPLTLGFAALTSLLAVPLALATAVLIHSRARFAGALAVVLLLPWAIAPIADGILWRLMFEPRTGIVTFLMTQLGLPPVVIREAPGAVVAMVVAVTWRSIPILAILFLGALRVVRPEVRQAARLDGASSLQVFRYVTLPAIAPVVIAGGLLQVILALQVFEVQYAMSSGAPPKGSMLAGFAIFNTVIGEISLGYGSAMTMVVGLFIALCLAGLYLVIVRPRRRVVAPDRDDGLDVSPIRTDPRAWARLGATRCPATETGDRARPPGRRGRTGVPLGDRPGPCWPRRDAPPRRRAGGTARVDRHRQHPAAGGGRPDAAAAHRQPRPLRVRPADHRPGVAGCGRRQHHGDRDRHAHRPGRVAPGRLPAGAVPHPRAPRCCCCSSS